MEKKKCWEAMQSAIMRIPRMDVRVARDLIDIKLLKFMNSKVDHESIFDEIKDLRPETPTYRMAYLRMGIYFAKTIHLK